MGNERELMVKIALAKKEIARVLVGQLDLVDKLLIAIASGGHVLVEGVPGLAKTLAIRTLSRVSGCTFSRIQFTPDLLPTDITGLVSYSESGGERVMKGPVFANFVLADEINRAPPKVQSALLEAMQEGQVTIGKETYPLPRPFFVMATQNPLESLGTYPLPYTQLDRFLFKVHVGYPTVEDEQLILDNNISTRRFEDYGIKPVLKMSDLLELQAQAACVKVPDKVKAHIVDLVDATRNPDEYHLHKSRSVEWGVSARATLALLGCSRAKAMLSGRKEVDMGDVKFVAPDILNHRLLINYEGQAEGVKPGDVVNEILAKVK
ncbi:MAG: MoxR family ATPase [Candidatus Micrarchaeota archaeon]